MAVYVIKAGDFDLYKVGWSMNPQKRLQDLQVASPFTLTLVAVLETDDPSAERRVHNALRSDHEAGEWFQLLEAPSEDQLEEWAQRPDEAEQADALTGMSWEDRLAALRSKRDRADAEIKAAREAITAEVIACLNDGLAPASIARAAGLSRQAVYDIKRAADEGQAGAIALRLPGVDPSITRR